MAIRSVFLSRTSYPFFEEIYVEFDWFPGFALSQKRKCEIGLHQNFLLSYPQEKILEISGASIYHLGSMLSAMKLSKRTSRGVTSVESAFQSSRIYSDKDNTIGPFPEYLFLPGKECKKNVKEKAGNLHSYCYSFDNEVFYAPDFHISLFYDFLYLNALLESDNKLTHDTLINSGYTAFTDLATKSLNSQARSCAIFIGLVKAGLTSKVKTVVDYLELFRTTKDGNAMSKLSYENVQLLQSDGTVKLHSPIVPCRFTREQVEYYYCEKCSTLTNKKTPDNYLFT